MHKGVIKEVRNSLIAPGTLVRVKRGQEVPADLVLLCSEGEKGKCFITTANLDGETNLKTLRVPPPFVGYTPGNSLLSYIFLIYNFFYYFHLYELYVICINLVLKKKQIQQK